MNATLERKLLDPFPPKLPNVYQPGQYKCMRSNFEQFLKSTVWPKILALAILIKFGPLRVPPYNIVLTATL